MLPTQSKQVLSEQIALFAGAVAVLVIILIVGHVAIAIADRRDQADERDRLIALKGARNATWVLATGVMASLSVALVTEGNVAFTHLLLGFWVLAELADIVSRLVMYRRGD